MIGFFYNGIHSKTFNIIAKTINRPLLPLLRKRELAIPGKHGVYSFENETFGKRMIEVELRYVGTNFDELRTRARSIASWLNGYDGNKNLIFDDETDKYYVAKIYSDVGLTNLFKLGETTIIFECEPFAYGTTVRGVTATVTASGSIVTVSSSGTFETPPIITLQNNGLSAITTFTLTREVLI